MTFTHPLQDSFFNQLGQSFSYSGWGIVREVLMMPKSFTTGLNQLADRFIFSEGVMLALPRSCNLYFKLFPGFSKKT